jgi:hypothetical protein
MTDLREMIDKDYRLYGEAYETMIEIFSSRHWPWVSKKKAWLKCVSALAAYRDNIEIAEEKRTSESLKEEKLHKYKVTVRYENFPNYHDIRQEGEWFIFYYNGIVVTFRHKDEKFEHITYDMDIEIDAKDKEDARNIIEQNSKYHICSFEFEELSTDRKQHV